MERNLERNLMLCLTHQRGYYPKHSLIFPNVLHSASFALSDSVACQACNINQCNQNILYIDTKTRLSVLHFEEFVSQLDNTRAALSERCDYLIYDEEEDRNRIAFCELSCSSDKYVNPNEGRVGKRAKAYSQLMKSIEALLSASPLDMEILSFRKKEALFGWRERNYTGMMDSAMESMEAFSVTPDSEAEVLISQEPVMKHIFVFKQIKYPAHYQW